MARLRTRVERAAVLHRQAAAAISATAAAVDGYSPSSAPAEQYAEQHDLAARLRAAAADLVPGWLGTGLDAVSPSTPAGDTAVPAYLRLGLAHPLDDARFPAIAPLLGGGHLAIDADARDPRVAGLLRSVLLRLVAAAAPGSLTIRVIDGAGDGETTTAFAALPNFAPPATDHPGMQSVLIEADRWIQSSGGAKPSPDGRPNHYYVLVIASLPELTDGNDLARIAQLARAGVKNRLHLVVAGWPPPPLTAETTQPPLPYSTQVSLRNPYAWVGDPPGATYGANGVGPSRLNAPVYLDADPPAEVIRRVCAELAAAGSSDEPDGAPELWTPSPQRWRDYVAAAQRLDAVRREAAKVVTDQTAAVKRVRAELSTARRQVGAQHKQLSDLVRGGQPLALHPTPVEMGAADAALGRLAQAASARAAAARSAAAASKTGSFPTGMAVNPGTGTGGFPVVTPGATSQFRPGGPPGPPGQGPPQPGLGPPHPGPSQHGPSRHGPPQPGPPPHGPPQPGPPPHGHSRHPGGPVHPGSPASPATTGPIVGYPGPSSPAARPAHHAHNARAVPAPVQVTSPPRPAGPAPYAPVSGPGGRPPTTPAPTGPPPSGPGAPPPVSGPGGAPPPPGSGPGFGPPGPPPPGLQTPPGPPTPLGPPVSGVPHPAYVNTGSLPVVSTTGSYPVVSNTGAFPVVSAPPHAAVAAPVSGPPVPAPAGPPASYPRLPEAAMTMVGEARAALQRADAELRDIDARINRSPGLRNATIYGAYAVLFALVQFPMMASLTVWTNSPVAAVPCGLMLVVLSFWLAWFTIGFAYREPSGHRPRRTPALGIAISLLAAAPPLITTVWAATRVFGD